MQTRPAIRAVVFDLGGVLLRTDNPQPRVALAERLGMPRAALEELVFMNPVAQLAERGQASEAEVWAEVIRRLGSTSLQAGDLHQAFFGGDEVDFLLVDLIRRLRQRYTTALLSNTWISQLDAFVYEKLGMDGAFDFIISSAKAGMVKPNADIFHHMLEVVGARAEETIFVDDNAANITAAARLGIHAVRFTGTQALLRDLSALIDLPAGDV